MIDISKISAADDATQTRGVNGNNGGGIRDGVP